AVGGAAYVRQNEFTYLKEAALSANQKVIVDNSSYYASVDSVSGDNPLIRTASDGSAKLTANFNFSAGDFITHFPYGTEITHGGGSITIEEDQVTGGELVDVDPFL